MKYKNSKYNVFFEANNKKYIYNTLTTSIAELDEDTTRAIQNSGFDVLNEEILKGLLEQGFLANENSCEEDKYKYYYESTKYSRSADTLSIFFIPTYNCNLRCPYCYEGMEKKINFISKEKIDILIRFAEKCIQDAKFNTPIKRIEIELYGGEPMLCKKQLLYFCEGISILAQRYSLPIFFSMVSNMTLLDNQMIEMIAKYNITVQVSIDGTKNEHNKRRIYPDGSGTFDTIITNLDHLVKHGLKENIIIRLNTDFNNISSIQPLYEQLMKFSNDIYLGFLTKYGSNNSSFAEQCIDSSCAEIVTNEIPSTFYIKHNLPIPQRFGKKGPCVLNCENKFMIDCFLDVYKCDLLIGHKECSIGHLNEDGSLSLLDSFFSQMSYSPFKSEKCTKCKLLPMCGGGCPATEYLKQNKKDGNLNLFICDFTEETLKSHLIDYTKAMGLTENEQ